MMQIGVDVVDDIAGGQYFRVKAGFAGNRVDKNIAVARFAYGGSGNEHDVGDIVFLEGLLVFF